MRKSFSIILPGILLLICSACKREYQPPEINVAHNYLVVEGVILNSTDSPTVFNLSRTRKLSDTVLNIPERDASVSIEGDNGDNFQLAEIVPGSYRVDRLLLNNSAAYRINITTTQGGQYVSDFVEVKQAPQIDSLHFVQPGDLTIYVNTRDANNATRYYRWEYVETIQYHAEGVTEIGVDNGLMFFRDSTNQVYNCWQIQNSTDVFINSTAALVEDVVNSFPLITIPQNSEKIGVRYGLLVKQYAISQDAYLYFHILKKNTEQQGSIFDAQPSQLRGNVHSVNKPDEPVIGYVTASNVTQQRIFISNNQLDNWDRLDPTGLCTSIQLPTNPIDYRIYNYPDPAYVPWYFTGGGGTLVIAKIPCVDCRTQGGTSIKPAYW